MNVAQSWTDEEIRRDQKIDRKDGGIYPLTTVWGLSVNGCCNPSLRWVFSEYAEQINRQTEQIMLLHTAAKAQAALIADLRQELEEQSLVGRIKRLLGIRPRTKTTSLPREDYYTAPDDSGDDVPY